jgi:cell division protein FtsL
MIKGLLSTFLFACIAGAIGIGLFFVKHEVRDQEARLAELNQEIRREQEAIHILKAEWSYLNDPARLRQLSEKFLSMRVMGPAQITSLTGPRRDATATASLPAVKPPTMPTRADPPRSRPEPARSDAARAEPIRPIAPAPALAATPVPAPAPVPPAAPAPGRTIIIQSPALAQTPDGPGGDR